MIDEDNKTFRRLRGQEANEIDNDEMDQPYLDLLSLRVNSPMEILWVNNEGREKIRISTPVKEIVEINTI